MTILVKGVFRRKVSVGFSIFKSDKWFEDPFTWTLDTETKAIDYPVSAPDLEFEFETSEDKYFIRAMVRSRAYVLCEVQLGKARAFSYSILSVKDVEVRGRVAALTGDPVEDANVIAEVNMDADPEPRVRRSRRRRKSR
jgi:hypothetical protein